MSVAMFGGLTLQTELVQGGFLLQFPNLWCGRLDVYRFVGFSLCKPVAVSVVKPAPSLSHNRAS